MLDILKKQFTEHLFLMVALIATIIAYAGALQYPHISWDDPEMVFRNKDVVNFNVSAFFSSHYVGNYIPLTMLTHAIDWVLFGKGDTGHHLVNLLLHLLNGYLVHTLTLRLFKDKNIAGITVIIFLLHPLQSESVNWISELKNLAYALFYLLAILQYLNFNETKENKYLLRCGIFFVVSCLYKPAAVVLPLSLMCIDLFLDKKLELKKIANKLPFVIISMMFGIVNLKTQAADQFINYSHNFPILDRVSNSGYALFKYTHLFLVPYDLSVIYPFPEKEVVFTLTGFAFLALIGVVCFLLYKKKLVELIAVILFILSNLILVLQFIPFGEVLYADRYMYVALIGLAWIVAILIQRIPIPKMILPFVLIAGLCTLAITRNSKWKNSITLYEDIIKKYPDNFLALNSLGVENMMRNDNDRARMYFNRATTVAPYNYKGFYNKGLLYLKENNPKKAVEEFNTVLNMYQYPKAYVARASAYYSLMDYEKAIRDAVYTLERDKDNPKAYFILGNCANDKNDLVAAIGFYRKAIEFNKNEPDYYFRRALTYGKQLKYRESIEDLDACLKLEPNYVDAYYLRGIAKANLKQDPCADLQKAAEAGMDVARGALAKFCR